MLNSKYIFISLKERNGEYEYTHRIVDKLLNSEKTTVKKFLEGLLKGFYGGKPEKERGGYSFFGGEIFVKVDLWRFISPKDFNILSQYL